MIKVDRVTVGGNIPFENVQILTEEEQHSMTNFFEDSQIVIKCKSGLFTLPMYKVSLILLSRSRKLNVSLCEKVKRLSLSGDMTFSPAYILKPENLEASGIPLIFKKFDQFTFHADEGIYITTDFNITMIEH